MVRLTLVAVAVAVVAAECRRCSVSVVTWNWAERAPSEDDCAFIQQLAESSDIVALGVQELEDIKPRRAEGHRSVEWRRLQRDAFSARRRPKGGRRVSTHTCVARHAVGGMQLSVWARRTLLEGRGGGGRGRRPCTVRVAEVACGIGNALHNKGAIGCFVDLAPRGAAAAAEAREPAELAEPAAQSEPSDAAAAPPGLEEADGGARLLFVNSHLAAHQHRVSDRRDDYLRICRELEQAIPPAWWRRPDDGGDDAWAAGEMDEDDDEGDEYADEDDEGDEYADEYAEDEYDDEYDDDDDDDEAEGMEYGDSRAAGSDEDGDDGAEPMVEDLGRSPRTALLDAADFIFWSAPPPRGLSLARAAVPPQRKARISRVARAQVWRSELSLRRVSR